MFLFGALLACGALFPENLSCEESPTRLGLAVEFTDHAASAHLAFEKGWFAAEGLHIKAYESYVTGMALAAALARGDIHAAYLCLVPALNVFANARVPIRIVAGTHRDGYGLVVNPSKIRTPQGLEASGLRLGCVREGGSVDVLLHRLVDSRGLNRGKVLRNVRRMSPPKQLLAFRSGQLDAVFLPEHWASMAEAAGGKMLLDSGEIWPDMQGSVLVVKQELLDHSPETVGKLVRLNARATDWINRHPDEAALTVSRYLDRTLDRTALPRVGASDAGFRITPEIIRRSMDHMRFTTDLDPSCVGEVIRYLDRLDYITRPFSPGEIIDERFLHTP